MRRFIGPANVADSRTKYGSAGRCTDSGRTAKPHDLPRRHAEIQGGPAYGSFKAWLLNLTRWRITDQVRKRRPGEIAREEPPKSGAKGDTTSTPVEERVPDPAGNALEAIWNDEWEKHVVDAALEKVKQQSSGKHYQIFFVQAIKQIPPAKVAETLNVKVDQVYLIKHRLGKIFEEAIKEMETKLG